MITPNTPMTPPLRTTLSPGEAISILWEAHQAAIGGPCATPLLEMLAAQSSLETGRWQSMWCWNFGNIRGHSSTGAWTSIKGASEIVDGKEVFYDVGPENKFAAYASPPEGARAFVRFLGTSSHPPTPNRYQGAWEAAERGDVDAYCAELKAHGYFTADLHRYAHGVRLTLEWLRSAHMPKFLAGLHHEGFPL